MKHFKIPAFVGVTILGLIGWLALGNIWIPSVIVLALVVGAAHNMAKASCAWGRLAIITLIVPCVFTGQLLGAIVISLVTMFGMLLLRKTAQEK